MNKKNIIVPFLITVICFLGLFFWVNGLEKVQAGKDDNVYGWAWSENIGWISFNSDNCGSNRDENTDTTICSLGVDYGVRIDGDGDLSGYAWSENIGWISFNNIDGCPNGNCGAKYDSDNGNITGWARACAGAPNSDCTGVINPNSGGWDGWISLRDNVYHGIYIEDKLDPNPDEFIDWAWGGGGTGKDNAVIGWISFNCIDGGENQRNICGTGPGQSNYKVLTDLDSVIIGDINLNINSDHCSTCGLSQYMLTWDEPNECSLPQYTCEKTLNVQGYDEIDISSSNGGYTLVFDHIGSNDFIFSGSEVIDADFKLVIKIKESDIDIAQGEDVFKVDKIPVHAYPCEDFKPKEGNEDFNEEIKFCSVYEEDDGGLEICPDLSECWDASGDSSYGYCLRSNWLFVLNYDDNNSAIETNIQQNPLISFSNGENIESINIDLEVCDSSNYCCPANGSLGKKREPTEWIEK